MTNLMEKAGQKADEVVELLRQAGYDIDIKKLALAQGNTQAVLALEISFSLQPELFEE